MTPNCEQGALDALNCIEQAEARKRAAVAAAEAAYFEEAKKACTLLNTLGDELHERAFELACKAGDAPVSRGGHALPPSSAGVCEEGLELRWYNNDGPDDCYTATWAQLRGEQPASPA